MPLQGSAGTKAAVALISFAAILFAFLAGSSDDAARIAYLGAAGLLWLSAGLTMGLKPAPEATV